MTNIVNDWIRPHVHAPHSALHDLVLNLLSYAKKNKEKKETKTKSKAKRNQTIGLSINWYQVERWVSLKITQFVFLLFSNLKRSTSVASCTRQYRLIYQWTGLQEYKSNWGNKSLLSNFVFLLVQNKYESGIGTVAVRQITGVLPRIRLHRPCV